MAAVDALFQGDFSIPLNFVAGAELQDGFNPQHVAFATRLGISLTPGDPPAPPTPSPAAFVDPDKIDIDDDDEAPKTGEPDATGQTPVRGGKDEAVADAQQAPVALNNPDEIEI